MKIGRSKLKKSINLIKHQVKDLASRQIGKQLKMIITKQVYYGIMIPVIEPVHNHIFRNVYECILDKFEIGKK